MSTSTCTTQTLTQYTNIAIDEVQTYKVGNSNDTISFVESNFGTAPTFSFADKDLTGWTINAYVKRTNNPSGTTHTVGTVAGVAETVNMVLTVDFSDAVTADEVGKYNFEIWAVNDVDDTKKVLLYPNVANGYIVLDIINRIVNG